MRPLVVRSIEDETGDRCVDLVQLGERRFVYRECRRDPEDSHGWRHLSQVLPAECASEAAALTAAADEIAWLRKQS